MVLSPIHTSTKQLRNTLVLPSFVDLNSWLPSLSKVTVVAIVTQFTAPTLCKYILYTQSSGEIN